MKKTVMKEVTEIHCDICGILVGGSWRVITTILGEECHGCHRFWPQKQARCSEILERRIDEDLKKTVCKVYVMRKGFQRNDGTLTQTYDIFYSMDRDEVLKTASKWNNRKNSLGNHIVPEEEPRVMYVNTNKYDIVPGTWFLVNGYNGFKNMLLGMTEEQYHDFYWRK